MVREGEDNSAVCWNGDQMRCTAGGPCSAITRARTSTISSSSATSRCAGDVFLPAPDGACSRHEVVDDFQVGRPMTGTSQAVGMRDTLATYSDSVIASITIRARARAPSAPTKRSRSVHCSMTSPFLVSMQIWLSRSCR